MPGPIRSAGYSGCPVAGLGQRHRAQVKTRALPSLDRGLPGQRAKLHEFSLRPLPRPHIDPRQLPKVADITRKSRKSSCVVTRQSRGTMAKCRPVVGHGFLPDHPQCPDGGTGRRAGLKIPFPLKECRFDSDSGHQLMKRVMLTAPSLVRMPASTSLSRRSGRCEQCSHPIPGPHPTPGTKIFLSRR